uniref:Reverse transcriptase domain-containing protein n=1 Tax=Mola mola TaxID=94237 RepID=A0A3Q4BB32_MOLML
MVWCTNNSFLKHIKPYEESTFASLLGDIKRDQAIAAINQLNSNKSPGPHGLPAEYYKLCLDDIIDLLTFVFNSGLKNGTLCDSFYQGTMYNYRQLTLMNADHKILAKIIMNRLNDVLEIIIEKEQTCAIKGRLM